MKAERCETCVNWGEKAKGTMPGVTKEHRKCNRPRNDKSITEYRHPTDWCDQYTGRANG